MSPPSDSPFPTPSPSGARRARASWWLRVALASLLLGGLPAPRDARVEANEGDAAHSEAGPEHREYQIKAAFLLNFIRYTTWPAESFPDESAPVVLTVVGKDPFGTILEETFEGEEANGRSIAIVRVREVPASLAGHVVFCADHSKPVRSKLLEAAAKRAILVVGETPDFAAEGACINFYLEDKKTRFEVNTDAVKEAALAISPAVLKLAKIVKTRREDER